MMRQMGGSFGIALINTYIAHRAADNRNSLVTHITATDLPTQDRLRLATARFVSTGSTVYDAGRRALAALEATVERQTFLMSYMDAFLLLALLNACCIPLLMTTIRKKKKGVVSAPAVKVEVEAH